MIAERIFMSFDKDIKVLVESSSEKFRTFYNQQKYKLNMSDFEINKIPLKLGNIHLKFQVDNNNFIVIFIKD